MVPQAERRSNHSKEEGVQNDDNVDDECSSSKFSSADVIPLIDIVFALCVRKQPYKERFIMELCIYKRT